MLVLILIIWWYLMFNLVGESYYLMVPIIWWYCWWYSQCVDLVGPQKQPRMASGSHDITFDLDHGLYGVWSWYGLIIWWYLMYNLVGGSYYYYNVVGHGLMLVDSMCDRGSFTKTASNGQWKQPRHLGYGSYYYLDGHDLDFY